MTDLVLVPLASVPVASKALWYLLPKNSTEESAAPSIYLYSRARAHRGGRAPPQRRLPAHGRGPAAPAGGSLRRAMSSTRACRCVYKSHWGVRRARDCRRDGGGIVHGGWERRAEGVARVGSRPRKPRASRAASCCCARARIGRLRRAGQRVETVETGGVLFKINRHTLRSLLQTWRCIHPRLMATPMSRVLLCARILTHLQD